MEFPRMMYRPGTAWALESGLFDLLTVESAELREAALADGWRDDQVSAMNAAKPAAPAADVAPAKLQETRAELEARAADLGLRVDGRWSDARLLAEIEKAVP